MYASLLVLVLAQPPQAPPVISSVPVPPQAPEVIQEQSLIPPLMYHQAHTQAIKGNKYLVVSVGRWTMPKLKDIAVVVGVPPGEFDEYPERCVIISKAEGG